MNFNKMILMHHGIKGQKWGVRRFQNKDGTLTLAGKERYRDANGRQPNLTTDTSEATRKLGVQMGYLTKDREGYYDFTEKGHQIEKARRQSLSVEESDKEVKSLNEDWFTDPENSKVGHDAVDRSARVAKEISSYVGELDNGHAKNDHAAKVLAALDKARNAYWDSGKTTWGAEYDRMRQPFYDQLSSIVLKELGYADTAVAREAIEPLWQND